MDSLKSIHGTISKLAGHVRKAVIRIGTLEKKTDDIEKKISVNTEEEEKKNSLVEALAETNRTLVEIQKQLALDFANRIAEEKKSIKKVRQDQQKEKVAAEESRLEKGAQKLGEIGSGIVSKITAPVKGIFEKIKEFFGLLLANILLNKAFKWLQDDNNKKILHTIFDWIGKSFVPVLIAVVGIKVFKWVRRLYKLGKFLLKIPLKLASLLGKILPGAGKVATTAAAKKAAAEAAKKKAAAEASKKVAPKAASEAAEKLAPKAASEAAEALTPKVASEAAEAVTPKVAEKAAKKPGIFGKVGNFFGGIGSKINNKAKEILIGPIIKSVLPNLPPAVQTKVAAAVGKKGLSRFLPYLNTILAVPEAVGRVMEGDFEGALLSAAGAIPFVGWGALALDIYRSVDPEGYAKNIRGGMQAEEMNSLLTEGMAAIKDVGLKFSEGGTVPGQGPSNVDSVDADLAPGEEVVKTSSSMLFRPLLKDINDNAGRKYTQFARAVNLLKQNSEYQSDVSKEYEKVIEDFDKSLKKSIEKNTQEPNRPTRTTPPPAPPLPPPSQDSGTSTPSSGTAGSIQPKEQSETPTAATITPSPSASSDDKSVTPPKASVSATSATPPNLALPSTSDGPKFSFIDLPVQEFGGIKSMPSIEKTATDIDIISPINQLNPYMTLTQTWYGIYM